MQNYAFSCAQPCFPNAKLCFRYENGNVNADIITGIAMKYEDRKENDKAAEFYSILIKDYSDSSSEYYIKGKFFLASHEFIVGNENALRDYIADNPNSPKNYKKQFTKFCFITFFIFPYI